VSYDLARRCTVVHAEFVKWFKHQTEWSESHDYNDPEAPSAPLRAWFSEMIVTYPPMNGPLASDDPDDPCVTDYSLGRCLIYAAFAKQNVGFADVSSDNFPIWIPSGGKLQAMK